MAIDFNNNFNNVNSGSDLNIGSWLERLHAHSDKIFSSVDKSLFLQVDSKITDIYEDWIKEPGITVGDVNCSDNKNLRQNFSIKMDIATKHAEEKLETLYNQLLAQQKQDKENNSSLFMNNKTAQTNATQNIENTSEYFSA